MRYIRHDRKNRPFFKVFLFSSVCNLCTFFALTLIASLILTCLKNPIALIGVAAFAVLSLTGAFSGFCTAKFKGENGALPSTLCSLILALLIFAAGLIAGGGRVSLIGPINLLSYLVFSFTFALLSRKKRKYRR